MAENISGLHRSMMCGALRDEHIGQEVTLMGWVQRRRNLGNLIFIDLRDRSGIAQIVFDDTSDSAVFAKAAGVRGEFVLAARGVVRLRSSINEEIPTGRVEVLASELRVLSEAQVPPFNIDENQEINEALKLKYRYLDLRKPTMQRNIIVRHRIAKTARDFFDENGFLEIETPMLTKSTPEGARDYLVPSRVHPGSFYALPQSPQIYKQLLMLSGMDRYVQIVKCFRDEDLRADRQPEFTQIDLEMSFVDVDDVISINEQLVRRIFGEVLGLSLPETFPRLTYREAMERYGCDKPDTRFAMELLDITDLVRDSEFKVFADNCAPGHSVRLINAKGGGAKFSRKEIDALGEVAKLFRAKGLAWINFTADGVKSPIAKFLSEAELEAIRQAAGAQEGDLLLVVADRDKIVFDALANLRLEVARKLDLIDPDKFCFLWVTEFPQFEYSEEEQRFVAMHHPFTAPMDEDVALLESDPGSVRAKAYDIVLNGVEMGGGSIRIHDAALQERMFRALGFSKERAWEKFGYLMEAFQYGTPPHGGMAYGLDRMVMLMLGLDSIRDVIAFPKVQNASELMSGAPTEVDPKQLAELGLKLDLQNS